MAGNTHHQPAGKIARQALSLLALERGDILTLTVYSVLVGFLYLTLPLAAQALFANVAFGTLLQPVLVLSFIVLGLLSFSGALQLLENIVVERLQRRYFARVAMAYARSLTTESAPLANRSEGIDRANRFFEIVNIQKTVSVLLLEGLALALQMLVGLALLAIYHPLLLAFDLCLILSLSLIAILWGRRAIETAVDESKAKLKVANSLHEIAGSPLTFKSTSGKALASSRIDALTSDYVAKRTAHFHVLFWQISGAAVLQILANASVLAIGGWLVIIGQLTLGQLVAAEIVVSSVAAGVGKLGKYLEAFYDLSASTDKIAHVLLSEEGPDKGSTLTPNTSSDIALRFHEVVDDCSGLDQACWSVPRGQIVGVYRREMLMQRPMAELLTGSRRPDAGRIELLGDDYRELSTGEILEHVTMVNRCEVFPGSVYDNVSVARKDVDKTVARDALAAVDLLEPMLSLPDGLQTRLEEHGNFLAPGQRWRLMLARALAHSCPIIIIETLPAEMTANEFSALLVRLRPTLANTRTSLILFTGNLEVLNLCDSTFEIADGNIVPRKAKQ